MTQNFTEVFSRLFRDTEIELGTRDMDILVLDSLIDAIESFQSSKGEDFCKQFCTLLDYASNTEPKFGIIIYHLTQLSTICLDKIRKKKNCDWKKIAVKEVQKLLDECKNKKSSILHYAEKIKVEHKTILIHDHSHTVQDVLRHLKSKKINFKVIIAEQDFEKTHANIEALHAAQIPFQVIPAYMLSHIHEEIDMLFFGAVTLKDTMQFVMDPGTHSVISEFHIGKKPIYMFLDTSKFSLWKSKRRSEIFIHKHERQHYSKPTIKYERIKYSHDRVEAELFHKIITDEGVFTPGSLKKFFDQRMQEHYVANKC